MAETVNNGILKYTFASRQSEAYKAVLDKSIFEILYGGAKGGGKSVWGTRMCYLLCKMFIDFFGLKPSGNPPIVGFMGRKQSVDFRDTTLETFKREVPPDEYRILEQKKIININNSIALRYGGMDNQDDVKKFNSAEFAFVFVDQAEELDAQELGLLRGTLRLKINGLEPPCGYKALWTANPAISVLQDEFIDDPRPGYKFIKALYTDNPFLPASYGETLDRAFSFNPTLLSAYKKGIWSGLAQAYVVMPRDIVLACVGNTRVLDGPDERRITVVDIAEDGDDETVIYDMKNSEVVDEEIYAHVETMNTVGRVQAHALKNKSNLICIDKVGLGAGAYGRLVEVFRNESQMTIYGFDGRVKPPKHNENEITYANYRAYAWFKAGEKMRARKVIVPRDNELIRQLSCVTYRFTSERNGLLILDSKEEIKRKLRKSPDRGDAYVMGLDALERAHPVSRRDKYMRRPPAYSGSPVAVLG